MGVGLRGCWSLVGPPRTPVNTNPDSRSGWNRPVHYCTNLKANDYPLLIMNHYLLSGTHGERCFHCHCVRSVHTNHRGSLFTMHSLQNKCILQLWLYTQVYLGYTQLVTDHFAESQLSRSDAVFLWQKYYIEERRRFPINHEKEREMKVFKILTPFSWQTAVTLPSQGSRSYQSWLGRAKGSLRKVLRASYI